jgi:5-methylcytosine-specific restriction endonuclease McrA
MLYPKHNGRAEKIQRRQQQKETRSAAVQTALDQDGRCMAFCCSCRTDRDPFARTLDGHHIVPLSQGGLDVAENIITLCHKYAHQAAHHGYKDGGQHIPAAVFMYETMARLRDTCEWRWSEEAWQFTRRRYEKATTA